MIVLASTSPQRRAILEQLRIPFEVVAPAAYTIGLTPPPAGDVKPAAVRVPRTGVVRLHLTVQPTP